MKSIKLTLLAVAILLATLAANPATAPSAPRPITPISNQLTTNLSPELKWTGSIPTIGVNAVAGYEYDVATDALFTAIVDNGNVPEPTHSAVIGPLNPHTTYYWRVRSYNGAAEFSGWMTAVFRTAIDPTTLTAPLDLAVLLYNRPTFEWTSVLNAESYTIQISQYSNFAAAMYSYTVAFTSTSYTMTVDLPANKVLYWRVRANSIAYGPSAWSTQRSFTTATPPSTPVLYQPRTGKVTDDYSPKLIWKTVYVPPTTTFGKYEIEISTTKLFQPADIVFTDDSVTDLNTPWFTLQEADNLDPMTTFYWHVRAYNSIGAYSNWSTYFILKTTIEPVTTLVAPLDVSLLDISRPSFDWNDVTDATGYTLEVSLNSVFSQVVLRQNVYNSDCTPLLPLRLNSTFYWRVRTLHPVYGPSAWSPVWSFTTPNPPSAPILRNPLNNSLTTNYTPTLAWSVSYVPTGATFLHYQVQLSDDSTFATTVIDDTVLTQYGPTYVVAPALDPATKYYWRVRACNTAVPMACSNWSAVFSLRTSIEATTLVAPADLSSFAYNTPINLDWSDVTGASGYNIYISRVATFAPILYVYNSYVSEFLIPRALPPGTYYWKVRAASLLFGPGPWTAGWSFTITP